MTRSRSSSQSARSSPYRKRFQINLEDPETDSRDIYNVITTHIDQLRTYAKALHQHIWHAVEQTRAAEEKKYLAEERKDKLECKVLIQTQASENARAQAEAFNENTVLRTRIFSVETQMASVAARNDELVLENDRLIRVSAWVRSAFECLQSFVGLWDLAA
ncbi:hypothetical protein WJX72_006069 [[Myrmecia] bisecta]|uniref:Uncharacterized protein n=1 Tax=[Myrmecia] bisecta TaxID=41462 RepID=A0AAW1PPL1_9CHLO